jgi:putative transposase
MQQRLLYEDKDLGRAFQEMRELWQEGLPTEPALKGFLEGLMQEERERYLRAAPFERKEGRRDWANGHYRRDLGTERGLLLGVRVPRVRGGKFRPKVLSRYRRRRQAVDACLRQCFLAGVSTRRVGACVQGLLGEAVSASTVCRVCASLTKEVSAFHRRPLLDCYRYLWLDGLVFKLRGAVGRQRKTLFCATGLTWEGRLEVIDFRLAKRESEGAWGAFLNDLYHRGLFGRALRLMVTDGCAGLLRALDLVYPFVPKQRCFFHKMQNVAAKVRRKDQGEVTKGARRIYLAQTRKEALSAFGSWARRWRGVYPKAVKCLEEDLEELLAHFQESPDLRACLRTTNPLERAFREVRRRTRPMTVMNHGDSLERVAYSVFHYFNAQWQRRPRKTSTQNS